MKTIRKLIARSQPRVTDNVSTSHFLRVCLQNHISYKHSCKNLSTLIMCNIHKIKSNISTSKTNIIFFFLYLWRSSRGGCWRVPVESFSSGPSRGAPAEGLIYEQQGRYLAWDVTSQTLMRLSICICSLSILTRAVYSNIKLNLRYFLPHTIKSKHYNNKFKSYKKKSL